MAIEKQKVQFGTSEVTVIHDTTAETYALLMTGDAADDGAIPVPAVTTMQSAAVANANGTSLVTEGYATAVIQITGMSGGVTVVNFEASADNSTWVAINADQVGGTGALSSTTTADGDFRFNVAGFKSLRARISAYSAGTITVKGYVTALVGVTRNVINAEIFQPVAEDNTVGVIKAEERYSVLRRTTEGQIFTGAGKIHSISINPLTATPTAGLLSIYDSLTETGTVVYSTWVFATTNSIVWTPDILMTTGCYVGFDATLANVSVEVAYRTTTMS